MYYITCTKLIQSLCTNKLNTTFKSKRDIWFQICVIVVTCNGNRHRIGVSTDAISFIEQLQSTCNERLNVFRWSNFWANHPIRWIWHVNTLSKFYAGPTSMVAPFATRTNKKNACKTFVLVLAQVNMEKMVPCMRAFLTCYWFSIITFKFVAFRGWCCFAMVQNIKEFMGVFVVLAFISFSFNGFFGCWQNRSRCNCQTWIWLTWRWCFTGLFGCTGGCTRQSWGLTVTVTVAIICAWWQLVLRVHCLL